MVSLEGLRGATLSSPQCRRCSTVAMPGIGVPPRSRRCSQKLPVRADCASDSLGLCVPTRTRERGALPGARTRALRIEQPPLACGGEWHQWPLTFNAKDHSSSRRRHRLTTGHTTLSGILVVQLSESACWAGPFTPLGTRPVSQGLSSISSIHHYATRSGRPCPHLFRKWGARYAHQHSQADADMPHRPDPRVCAIPGVNVANPLAVGVVNIEEMFAARHVISLY